MTADQIIGTVAAAVIATGILIPLVRFLMVSLAKALAVYIVKAINGQLGLDGIREDVTVLKGQVENLEGQLEAILTDL